MTEPSADISREQAAHALGMADAAARRAGEAIGYGNGGPFVILWGFVWTVGYAAQQFFPAAAGRSWLVLIALGWLGTLALCYRLWIRLRRQSVGRSAGGAIRGVLTAAIISLYAWLWIALIKSGHPHSLDAYAGTVTGFAFLLLGVWRGHVYALLGLAVTVLFLVGLAVAGPWFNLYAAGVGGLGLISGGAYLMARDLR